MAIVRWPAQPTQPWKPRPDQQQQTCLSNSQPSHKNDYNLDDDGDDDGDDGDDDAYEATNQFVGARVSGKTCDVDNVTALACDHVRQESLLWTRWVLFSIRLSVIDFDCCKYYAEGWWLKKWQKIC